ncbi:MAG: hypothetical protein ACK5MZ_01330, partial [Aestuariibaculum sp.]
LLKLFIQEKTLEGKPNLEKESLNLLPENKNISIFLSEKEEGNGTRTFRGKTYTQEEWEAFEKQQWEKYKGK